MPGTDRLLGGAAAGTAVAAAVLGLVVAPPDGVQGEAQRLMYVHVPAAWLAYLCFAAVLVCSVAYLVRRDLRWDRRAQAAAELGVGMTALAIAMGSLWGRPVWGTWWVWDPRLVTTAVLLLVYLGYLSVLWTSREDPSLGDFELSAVTREDGFPTRAELIGRYEERSGRSIADLRWYTTLALWKSVVFMEGNYKRAISGTTDDPFLKTFGRPARELACECERESDSNLSQALQLIGGATVNNKLRDDNGRMATLAKGPMTPEAITRELYLVALSREPAPGELEAAVKHLAATPDRRQAIEDLFDVTVTDVRTVAVQSKPKRRGYTKGRRPGWKKAIVELKPGDKIELFEGA